MKSERRTRGSSLRPTTCRYAVAFPRCEGIQCNRGPRLNPDVRRKNNMKTCIAVALYAVILGLCACSRSGNGADRTDIYGMITNGMTRQQVESLCGNPVTTANDNGLACSQYLFNPISPSLTGHTVTNGAAVFYLNDMVVDKSPSVSILQ